MNAKVTGIEASTAPQQSTATPAGVFVVTDARGRRLRLQKPNLLAQIRLVKIVGESAKNTPYMQIITPLTYLVGIDDDEVYQPASEREIDALITRLDEEGYAALVAGIEEHFSAPPVKAQEETVKNS